MSENELFHFEIGDPPTRVSLHKHLVCSVSEQLSAMTSNGMLESQKGVAQLYDVEVDTFLRFAEWLYTDKYTVLGAVDTRGMSDVKDQVRAHQSVLPWEARVIAPSSEEEQSLPSLQLPSAASGQKVTGTFSVPPCCVEPFLSDEGSSDTRGNDIQSHCFVHAKLYVFADQRQIHALQDLASERLRESLRVIDDLAQRAILTVSLIDYAYGNTACSTLERNKLRLVIVESAVENIVDLMRSSVFVDTLEDGGRFVSDLVRMTTTKVVRQSEQNSALEDAAKHWQVFIANASY